MTVAHWLLVAGTAAVSLAAGYFLGHRAGYKLATEKAASLFVKLSLPTRERTS